MNIFFQYIQGEKSDHGNSFIPTTTLIKVLATFLCYTTVNVIALAGIVSQLNVEDEFAEELREYFICESTGVDPNRTCDRSFENLYNPWPSIVAVFLAGILYQPFGLLYIINLRNVYHSIRHFMRGIRSSNGTSTNMAARNHSQFTHDSSFVHSSYY